MTNFSFFCCSLRLRSRRFSWLQTLDVEFGSVLLPEGVLLLHTLTAREGKTYTRDQCGDIIYITEVIGCSERT